MFTILVSRKEELLIIRLSKTIHHFVLIQSFQSFQLRADRDEYMI